MKPDSCVTDITYFANSGKLLFMPETKTKNKKKKRKKKNALLSNSSKDLQLQILEKNLRCDWKWQRYCALLHQTPGARGC